jgi:hypothetical protein
MKIVEWTDGKGYRHKSKIRDNDPDSMAMKGIPCDPPNIDSLDWEEMKRELHNNMLDLNLTSWENVVKSNNGIVTVIQRTFKRPLVNLYKRELRDGGK